MWERIKIVLGIALVMSPLLGLMAWIENHEGNACDARGGVYKRGMCFDPKMLK